MTTGETVTALYTHFLSIGDTAADNATLRARILLHLQQAVNRLFPFRPWPWSFGDGTVSISANASSGQVPTTFGWAGPYMKVYVSSAQHQLRYMAPGALKESLEMYTGTANRPTHYTLSGIGADNRLLLHVYPKASTSLTIQLRDFKRKPPTLIDEVVDAGGDNGEELKEIPEQYHETLLFDYAVKRLMRDEGDDRDPAQELEFRQAMAEAWAEENNQTPRRAPRYGARGWS